MLNMIGDLVSEGHPTGNFRGLTKPWAICCNNSSALPSPVLDYS